MTNAAHGIEEAQTEAQPPTEADPPTHLTSADIAARAAKSNSVFSLPLTPLNFSDPLQWLRLGWADFKRCPRIGLFYGLCFFAMGHALLAVFQNAPAYVLALSAGFLLMGPFL